MEDTPFRQPPTSLGRRAVARLRTRKKPHISVTVVRTGLETRAGSSFMDLRTSGRTPPKVTAKMVLAIKAPPTTRPRKGFSSLDRGYRHVLKQLNTEKREPGVLVPKEIGTGCSEKCRISIVILEMKRHKKGIQVFVILRKNPAKWFELQNILCGRAGLVFTTPKAHRKT